MKKEVITMSTMFKIRESSPSGSLRGLSIAIVTVEMKMIERMNPSKYHSFTKECNEVLKEF